MLQLDTGEVDKVHDARLLAFAVFGFDELIKCDSDDRVSAAARRVHVGRRHCTTRCPYQRSNVAHTHYMYIGLHMALVHTMAPLAASEGDVVLFLSASLYFSKRGAY